MPDRTTDITELKFPKPRNLGMIIVIAIVLIIAWGAFVLIPAGHRGVVLLWGSVEKRIMGEGLNFKVPVAERVINQEINCSVRLTRGEASLNVYPYNSSQ
jgi:regulator of protease activity HflC (stomatin/prohibitin superfamily)